MKAFLSGCLITVTVAILERGFTWPGLLAGFALMGSILLSIAATKKADRF